MKNDAEVLVESDPIKIDANDPFDTRLAKFYVSTTENFPKTEDGSVGIKGSIFFGRLDKVDHDYGVQVRIGFKWSFLRMSALGAAIQPSEAFDELVDENKSSINEEVAISDCSNKKTSASASLGVNSPIPSSAGKLELGYNKSKEHIKQNKLRSARNIRNPIIRFVAGGIEIGDRDSGDARHGDTMLNGQYAAKEWCRAIPFRGEKKYEISMELRLPISGLVVIAPGSNSSNTISRSFRSLKEQVATWAMQDIMDYNSKSRGYDINNGELIVANAKIKVIIDEN